MSRCSSMMPTSQWRPADVEVFRSCSAPRAGGDRRPGLAELGQFRSQDRQPLQTGRWVRCHLTRDRRELSEAGYEAARIHSLPNGVPVPEIAWQRRADWRKAPRAIFVGRLAPEKGLNTLIDAWPLVRMSRPDARLMLLGEGPERTSLEAQGRSLGLTLGPDRAVEIPGVAVDVTATLRNADLFVLPSKEEGMSIALLEAMALGIPLVASSIPGNRRLVSDFKHGRLAPLEDPAALAR